MLRASYTSYTLQFKAPAGTSRGVLQQKKTWFIRIWDDANLAVVGIGECAMFAGLSADDRPNYEDVLHDCCQNINDPNLLTHRLTQWPSIQFGVESALCDLQNGGTRIIYPSEFTQGKAGIPINGLIWMGSIDYIKQQVKDKLTAGFRCLKFKVGALNLNDELEILRQIRNEFNPVDLEIRIDANGAFAYKDVINTLELFAKFQIHSVEQPIKAGNISDMAKVCRKSPIPVALDEELIGIYAVDQKKELLNTIRPQFIILKPSLIGGFAGATGWINLAKELNIDWWITSALESNIGLNAIAQWTYTLKTNKTQGLGTGSLYTNNIPSPLIIEKQQLFYNLSIKWDLVGIASDY